MRYNFKSLEKVGDQLIIPLKEDDTHYELGSSITTSFNSYRRNHKVKAKIRVRKSEDGESRVVTRIL